ncbi:MAG: bifunctional lysylphosphatidylglycerol synthetase/lysine--tRNA ligase LysX, partial [Aeromicrobium sp.]
SGIAEGFINIPERLRSRRGVHPQRLSEPELHAIVERQAEDSRRSLAERPVPEQMRTRIEKLDRVVAAGSQPYPSAAGVSHRAGDIPRAPDGAPVTVSGRLIRIRDHGGVIFADLRDWSGDVQVVLERERLGAQALTTFGTWFDLGDLADVTGTVGVTHMGHRCIYASTWRMSAKCLHPLPDKWRGMSDPDSKVRKRYVDLAINQDTRSLTRLRSTVVRQLRESLHAREFLEVETPVLQAIHGGANARPFTTHINAYDLDLYLRIAPELYLKRLCVGGMERVFEIGRTFRNEGADSSHNPEFTMLEAYKAHSDYRDMLDTCRELIQEAATAVYGEAIAMRPDGNDGFARVDLSGEWPVKTVHGAVSDAVGKVVDSVTPVPELQQLCDGQGIAWQDDWDAGQLVLELYEQLVEAKTQLPTFYTDFPVSVSPLTRSRDDNPDLVERWDLVAFGMELGTAYSELTDPVEQRRRLRAQSLRAAQGDIEAMELDEDFLEALEYGMPPTGGLGMGVDRLVMLLSGRNIRETLPFPLTKPLRPGQHLGGR